MMDIFPCSQYFQEMKAQLLGDFHIFLFLGVVEKPGGCWWQPGRSWHENPWQFHEVVEFDESLQDGATLLLYRQEFIVPLGGGFKYFFIFTPSWGRFPF